MRTRSQQASPGGLVSLDDDLAPRRTRSTRSNTQQDTAAPAQPATRSKSQRTTKKTDTTAKKPTAKAQTRKAASTKRATRQSSRKTDKAASDEDVHTSFEEEAVPVSMPNAENSDTEKKDETSKIEPKTAPKDSAGELSPPMDPKNHHTPDSQGTGAASCLLDDLSSIGSPLTEMSHTSSLASEVQTEAVLAPRTAQESGATDTKTPKATDKRSPSTPVAGDTFEQPAEPTVTGPMEWRTEASASISSEESKTSSLASVAGSGEGAVVEDELVGALVSAFAGLSLDNVAPRSSDEAAVPLMGSTTTLIEQPVELFPITPTQPVSQRRRTYESRQRVGDWAQQVPSTGYIHRITGQFVEGLSASVELAGVPTPTRGPPTRRAGVGDYFLRKRRREVQALSPLREESPNPGSGVPNMVPSLGSPGNRPRKASKKKLTRRTANRKRDRSEASDEDQTGPETPIANKRRNLGPPGSTPYRPATRPRALTANIAPYSERRRRRAVEKEGRIHATAFRVSQLLTQQENDRRRQASESSTPPSPFPQLPQSNFDFSIDDDNVPSLSFDQGHNKPASSSEQTPAVQQPVTPERVQRGWNIRGLLNSVPRRFSRMLPSFGRTPERAEVSAPTQPSSERIIRAQAPEPESTVSETQTQSSRSSSEEPPKKRARRSWSLFPPPIDRSLYLGDLTKKDPSSTPSKSQSAEETLVQEPNLQDSTASDSQEIVSRGGRAATHEQASETKQEPPKKRKRSPSPDVIPNPPGCSYGMDLDYFCYSSESDDEQEKTSQVESAKPETLAKTAVRSALRSERPSPKKVRFDASPENTPSKLRERARATDPYRGRQFIGMGGDSGSISTPEPSTPTPAISAGPQATDDPRSRPGFVPNLQGTFQLDYDAYSDDSTSSGSSGASAAANVPATSPASDSQSATRVAAPESVQSPEPRQTPRQAPAPAPPSTPAKIDDEALARARSQAEKYKPKTPSGLRTASRYSSPMTATPDMVPISTPATPAPTSTAAVSAPTSAQQLIEDFGDDEFAREAQWLYENCPSGDLRDLEWPQPLTYEEQGFSCETIEYVNQIWDPSVVDDAYDNIWTPGLEAFKRELEAGMSQAGLV
ncbi:hypothetical protein BO71DRAFT_467753 [Aspergillus ellipticus CBS 707.79]|uniref:Uncharacterized protein n=1 Tax=Aspergillus ellipticus CBS 707.79 TaxID=1448320 RepID=A0A319E0T9_9EURO|nr:hypothetical protein BO71DRAFT_467753 [Aspergillus ellipticus CBS 707.79]